MIDDVYQWNQYSTKYDELNVVLRFHESSHRLSAVSGRNSTEQVDQYNFA
jgi:hypothetical protein